MQQVFDGLNVVVGLGVTGLACVRYLHAQDAEIAVMDSRMQPPALASLQQEFPQTLCALGEFNSALLQKAQRLIVSPGVSLQEPLIAEQIARGIEVIGDIELFSRCAKAPIIGVTGSNGKTTVATLMGLMIKAAGLNVAVGGNIGQPALSLLGSAVDYYVLELSSFQLETTFSLQTATSVILNITPDHMDRYLCFEDYCAAKQRIYRHCQFPVVNAQQPEIWNTLALDGSPLRFGLCADTDYGCRLFQGREYLFALGRPLLAVEELPLKQRHHLENALAALALGHAIGLPDDAMCHVLRHFKGLPHRCELVCVRDGVYWYNDSKGTNVGATVAAIASIGAYKLGRLILIAGGDSKCADLLPICDPIKQYVDQLILLGQDALRFYELLHHAVPCTLVTSMNEAVQTANQSAQIDDIVLLSPACASFDMFSNYEHRGDVFVQCVRELG